MHDALKKTVANLKLKWKRAEKFFARFLSIQVLIKVPVQFISHIFFVSI